MGVMTAGYVDLIDIYICSSNFLPLHCIKVNSVP
jgi:hypothetical protein